MIEIPLMILFFGIAGDFFLLLIEQDDRPPVNSYSGMASKVLDKSVCTFANS
jgi:hypothetical protein